MPYDKTSRLPKKIKDTLPKEAQKIFKKHVLMLGINT